MQSSVMVHRPLAFGLVSAGSIIARVSAVSVVDCISLVNVPFGPSNLFGVS